MILTLPFKAGIRYTITQTFAQHVAARIAHGWKYYNGGIDYYFYDKPTETDIQAAGKGVVIFAGWDTTKKEDGTPGGYGQQVRIRHADGTVTIYAHLSAINVVTGQAVDQGDVIGLSGNTGNSTGPHLHFEVRNAAGVAVDPDGMMCAGNESPPAANNAAVQAIPPLQEGGQNTGQSLPKAGEVYRVEIDFVNDRAEMSAASADLGDILHDQQVTLSEDAILDANGTIWGTRLVKHYFAIRYQGRDLMKKVTPATQGESDKE